jgi:hypothetical protein
VAANVALTNPLHSSRRRQCAPLRRGSERSSVATKASSESKPTMGIARGVTTAGRAWGGLVLTARANGNAKGRKYIHGPAHELRRIESEIQRAEVNGEGLECITRRLVTGRRRRTQTMPNRDTMGLEATARHTPGDRSLDRVVATYIASGVTRQVSCGILSITDSIANACRIDSLLALNHNGLVRLAYCRST